MNTVIRRAGLAMVAGLLVLLAGCVSPGGYGEYPGGGYEQPGTGYPSQYGSQLEGTVEGVDTGYGRVLLRVEDRRSGRSERREVRYDRRTRLFYQGREYPVEGLERGDVVRVSVVQSGRDLWAESMEVVRNIRDRGYGRGYDDPYGTGNGQDLRGQVTFVEPRARIVQLDSGGYGGSIQVRYDDRTTAEFERRLIRPEDLQRGDVVRILGRPLGSNEWLAERIIVERPGGR